MRKAARIAKLESQLASKERDRAHPFIPFVEQAILDLGILAVKDEGADPEVTEAVAKAATTAAVFDALPAETRWQKLFDLFGDDIIKQALEQRRQLAAQRAQTEIEHGDMFEEAWHEGKLDTRKLIQGDKLSVVMFPGHTPKHLHTPAYRDASSRLRGAAISIDAVALGDTKFRVVQTWLSDQYFWPGEEKKYSWKKQAVTR